MAEKIEKIIDLQTLRVKVRGTLADGGSGAASPASSSEAARAATGVGLSTAPEAVRCAELCAARAAASSGDLVFVATRNARDMPWNQKITIKTPGRYRILAMISALSSACSRTDFFIFDGYLPAGTNMNTQVTPELQCLMKPELHLLVFWSAMPNDQFSRLHHVVAALSDVVSYPKADYHVRLHGVFRADPGEGKIDENWRRSLSCGARGRFVSQNILREQSPQWYRVHTTQTLQESDADYKFLFGGTAKEIFRPLQLDKLWSTAQQYREPRVDNGLYALAWRRVFIPVDAMEPLGAMMQSEWYRFELDVLEIHAELTPGMLDPDPTSSQENILRAAFLGSSRLPLLAHLPTDSRWYKGMLELKQVKAFRVLKENSWGRQLPPCTTVADAAAILSSESSGPEDSSVRDHVRQLQHRLDHFNHTIIVVGPSVDGPFTIWDGNHRAIALALTQADSHLLLVYMGVSPRFASPHRGSLYCP
ncbi:hypothetical protein PF007_g2252 [Phytophthora fragariae]|uniref:Uncharacterized protein n=1 Tax=Phytophthora fragariae TaxID=53985 RepID=A0A6A3FPB1_9STRA|nr:hypothetical protein PF009_g2498 [Phytophthora fragariae]KAE9136272.1 hypothetical protein PF007_g2252 [Phytophthora fragariae]KAE9252857.1 hypothetical protein PF004_g1761 [Phytophthora fragariae]